MERQRSHRAQVKLEMDCENTIRVELDKNYLPEFIVRAAPPARS